MENKIYIYGHKSPDTDSICSAISLAYLKNKMAELSEKDEAKYWGRVEKGYTYVPMAAEEINSETEYVLSKFQVDTPEIVGDIRRQVKDIEINQIAGIKGDVSLKEAWNKMHLEAAYTLPVLDDEGQMVGIITAGEIARTYMNVDDKESIGKAKTPYENIAEVLEGEVVCGDAKKIAKEGRVGIAAANIQLIDIHFRESDIAILSDDEEAQRQLINKKIDGIIICNNSPISEEIKELAKANDVTIISTYYDTYKVARMVNQSLPVNYLMTPKEDVFTFKLEDFVDDMQNDMVAQRFRDFPVLDNNGKYVGMISRASLINMGSKKVILVDHNELNQAVFGLFDAEILEIVDHHKLGSVETMQPISVTNKPLGCTSTIVYQMFKEMDIDIPEDIAGLMCSAIISDTMLFKSPTCTWTDREACRNLAKISGIDLGTFAQELLKASTDLSSKTDKEVFYQDYKTFETNGFTYGAGQVIAASPQDVEEIKNRMLPYLDIALEVEDIDMVCLMITDMSREGTELIFKGGNSKSIVESAFDKEVDENSIFIDGMVSRKKQLIPPIVSILQQ